jgi:O-antigen/teichoic acid export membrane protein
MLDILRSEGGASVRKFKYYVGLTLNCLEPVNHHQRRYQRIAQSVITAVVGKGVALLVSVVSVSLTVKYLGVERYGVWVTISTLLAWIQLADLGLGNGLLNAVSKAYGVNRPDLAQRYVATAFWMLCGVAILLGAVSMIVWGITDWLSLFNLQSTLMSSEVPSAIAIALFFTLSSLPLTTVDKVLGAYQEGSIANYWTAISNLASLVGVILVTQWQGNLVWLIIGFSGTIFFVKVVSSIWLFGFHKPWLAPRLSAIGGEGLSTLATVGGTFFIIQIAGLILFQTDNLIIAHYLGVAQVTPYSVTWRLFSFTTLIQAIIFPYLWPAYTEAYVRNDFGWIRRTFRANMLVTMSVTVPIIIVCVLYGQVIIKGWAGGDAVPTSSLLIWMGIWSAINVSMSVIACVLNSLGHVKGQAIYGSVTALVNLTLSIWLATYFGITGVIMGTVIAYAVCNIVPALIEMNSVLNKLATSTKNL